MTPLVVMHKVTGELKEMTGTKFSKVIWIVEYDEADDVESQLDYMIFEGEDGFNDYEILGEL